MSSMKLARIFAPLLLRPERKNIMLVDSVVFLRNRFILLLGILGTYHHNKRN